MDAPFTLKPPLADAAPCDMITCRGCKSQTFLYSNILGHFTFNIWLGFYLYRLSTSHSEFKPKSADASTLYVSISSLVYVSCPSIYNIFITPYLYACSRLQ